MPNETQQSRQDTINLAREILLQTEVSGNTTPRLSHAGTAKSGFSIGGTQVDLAVNKGARDSVIEVLGGAKDLSDKDKPAFSNEEMNEISAAFETQGKPKALSKDTWEKINAHMAGNPDVQAVIRNEDDKQLDHVAQKTEEAVEAARQNPRYADPNFRRYTESAEFKAHLIDNINQFGEPAQLKEWLAGRTAKINKQEVKMDPNKPFDAEAFIEYESNYYEVKDASGGARRMHGRRGTLTDTMEKLKIINNEEAKRRKGLHDKYYVPRQKTSEAEPPPNNQENDTDGINPLAQDPAPENNDGAHIAQNFPEQADQGEGQEAASIGVDPRTEDMLQRMQTPVSDPALSALLKPADRLTESEMQDLLRSAHFDYRGYRSHDPLKYLSFEMAQDWHERVYDPAPQGAENPLAMQNAFVAQRKSPPLGDRSDIMIIVPEKVSNPTTPKGEDLYEAMIRFGQQLTMATGRDGHSPAVRGLQIGLNILNALIASPRLNAKTPFTPIAPLAEDGDYGPKTDFALKHATRRLGTDKVEEGLALGRFNIFARDADKRGDEKQLADNVHSIFGPLFRDPKNDKAPPIEAGALQMTLNDFGAQSQSGREPLKIDNVIGPKTTQAFKSVLDEEDADAFTRAFGKRLGFFS